jgi:AcrR family transcriptional regulator
MNVPKMQARPRTQRAVGPGRPEGVRKTREEILDAAENVFSNLGYSGTSLREVADAAEVTQGSINYYFGSKYGLFEQVFLRRSEPIAKERIDRLNALEKEGNVTVRDIVQAFLLPSLAIRNTPQGRAFLRLQARLHTEPPEISYKLRTDAYGDSTNRYVESLRKAAPHLSTLDVYWRVTLMIGSYLYAFSDTHRMEEMVPKGLYNADDTNSLIDQITRFVVAGVEAS